MIVFLFLNWAQIENSIAEWTQITTNPAETTQPERTPNDWPGIDATLWCHSIFPYLGSGLLCELLGGPQLCSWPTWTFNLEVSLVLNPSANPPLVYILWREGIIAYEHTSHSSQHEMPWINMQPGDQFSYLTEPEVALKTPTWDELATNL